MSFFPLNPTALPSARGLLFASEGLWLHGWGPGGEAEMWVVILGGVPGIVL